MTTKERLYQVACAAVDKEAAALQELSCAIWRTPELNYQEHEAHRNLTAFLEARGLPVRRAYLTDTAFRADYGRGDTTVALLCEYDALPEIGHACGHNLIAELGVAASLGVKAALDAGGLDMGKLVVLGTPAEEGGAGKALLIEGGAFDHVDCAMMAHPSKANATQPWSLALHDVTVKFAGKASHASAFPWDGINALDAAVTAYNAVSCLRQQLKPGWHVHGIISNGGSKPNIIPEVAEMFFYVRAPSLKELEILKRKVAGCFQAAGEATGCTVQLVWGKRPSLDVIQNRTLISRYEHHLANFGVQFKPEIIPGVPTGSTDMGNVTYHVPGIHPEFDIGTSAYCHSREFTRVAGEPAAQPYVLTQAKVLAMTTIDVMCDRQLLEQAKADFRKDLQAKT